MMAALRLIDTGDDHATLFRRGTHHTGCASAVCRAARRREGTGLDRKSTRLNSSHLVISYAVFCLKKKKTRPNLYCVARTESAKEYLPTAATLGAFACR